MTRIFGNWRYGSEQKAGLKNELRRTFIQIGPERFEEMVTGAIDGITGIKEPATGDFRKWIPAPKINQRDTWEEAARARKEWERDKDTPEYGEAMKALQATAAKYGIKLTGEWEKSRPRRDD